MTQTYKDRYRQSLEPWAVYHHLNACKPRLMSRHRSRSDADGVAQWLTLNTQLQYSVVFDPSPLMGSCRDVFGPTIDGLRHSRTNLN